MKSLSATLAISILLASAVCAVAHPGVAAAAAALGALLARFAWRAWARKARDSESIVKMPPEMSTLTFPPRARH